jgi:hypothetical protein
VQFVVPAGIVLGSTVMIGDAKPRDDVGHVPPVIEYGSFPPEIELVCDAASGSMKLIDAGESVSEE